MKTEKQYWLAHGREVDQYGTIWKVELTDGPHGTPEGPVKALKIIKGIWPDCQLKNPNYVMVTVEPVPDIDVKVNEEAININKKAVDHYLNKKP